MPASLLSMGILEAPTRNPFIHAGSRAPFPQSLHLHGLRRDMPANPVSMRILDRSARKPIIHKASGGPRPQAQYPRGFERPLLANALNTRASAGRSIRRVRGVRSLPSLAVFPCVDVLGALDGDHWWAGGWPHTAPTPWGQGWRPTGSFSGAAAVLAFSAFSTLSAVPG